MDEQHETLDKRVDVLLVHACELTRVAAVLLRYRLVSHTYSFELTRRGMNTYYRKPRLRA